MLLSFCLIGGPEMVGFMFSTHNLSIHNLWMVTPSYAAGLSNQAVNQSMSMGRNGAAKLLARRSREHQVVLRLVPCANTSVHRMASAANDWQVLTAFEMRRRCTTLLRVLTLLKVVCTWWEERNGQSGCWSA